jgi:hypothetical protein
MAREFASPELANLIAARIAPEEFERRIKAPLTDQEVEDTGELVGWFTRRYPTVEERFLYVREKTLQYGRAGEEPPEPVGYEAAVRRLAKAHRLADPETVEVLWDPDPAERAIRLLEVTRSATTMGNLQAVEFVPRPDLGYPFAVTVLIVSPAEWLAVKAGTMELPEPFGLGRLVAVEG